MAVINNRRGWGIHGKLVNNYIALMEISCLTERSSENVGIMPHRGRLQHPLHVVSGLRVKIDIVPLPLLETY